MKTDDLIFADFDNETFDDVKLTLTDEQLNKLVALQVNEMVLMIVKYYDAEYGLIDAAGYFLFTNEGLKFAFYSFDKNNLYFYSAVENEYGL